MSEESTGSVHGRVFFKRKYEDFVRRSFFMSKQGFWSAQRRVSRVRFPILWVWF